jgi:hypothetical protein
VLSCRRRAQIILSGVGKAARAGRQIIVRLIQIRTLHLKIAAAMLLCALAGTTLLVETPSGSRLPVDCQLPRETQTLLLTPIFTDRLATVPLKNPKTETIDGLAAQLSDMFFPVDLFKDAYQGVVVTGYHRDCLDTLGCQYKIMSVDYAIDKWRYTSHAYYRWAQEQPGRNAAVIIPGSGLNQSSAIYLNDTNNYQSGIAGIVGTHWDMYVCVKPNEDFLAIHSGTAKLDYEYIVGHLANRGGSYSCRYIADTIAMVKHLKSTYGKVAVIGLSQGGQAALYNALQSEPDGAIISSGFSVLHETMQGASLGQIMMPGMREYLSNDHILEGMRNSDTEYLFTWGRDERAIYGVEAWFRCTRSFFAGLGNVTCISHSEGHVFPTETISVFLDNLRLRSKSETTEGALFQNAPNPFASSTKLTFRIGKEGHVRLAVFDAAGRLVRSLVNEVLAPDLYTEEWDGRDGNGRSLPSGTYFYHLNTAVIEEVKKMTLAR